MKYNEEYRVSHSEHQRFDEVHIVTNPRWKESELSGDEWRISVSVEFLYKGKVIWSHGFHNCETAMQMALTMFTLDCESMKVKIDKIMQCDQEGCSEQATVKAFLKKRYCVGWGNCGQEKKMYDKDYLIFCDKHSNRGDCGIEDADDNYDKVTITKKEPEHGR